MSPIPSALCFDRTPHQSCSLHDMVFPTFPVALTAHSHYSGSLPCKAGEG
jgi:hypothetical protein